MFDFLKPNFEQLPNIKFSYNLGALFDIPTGKYERGIYNESILNGGLGNITGIVGIGNNFKTSILFFFILTCLSRMKDSAANSYDTEINVNENRIKKMADHIHDLNKEDIIENQRLILTDKTKYFGDEWFEKIKDFMTEKKNKAKQITVNSPFLSRDKKTLLPMLIPTFSGLDSITKFETNSTFTIQDKNELGDSGANMLYMSEGKDKKRLLSYLPKPIQESNNYFLITAHVGKDIPIDPRAAPVKKLQYLKNNDVLKGVTTDFTFLTTNCWQCQNAAPLYNDTTKGPEYPRDSEDNMKGDTDLVIVTLTQLRSKVGPSGLIMQIIVSQQEGVLPGLTEFHYIKTNDRYGLEGSLQNYSLSLLPDVNLSRTTVRSKLEDNPMLRRAMTITSEMCQMKYLWHDLPEGLLCTPKELYEGLKAKGYDWNMLLGGTRGWWTYNNDKQPVPFLSTMDLLRMNLKEDHKDYYFPYWLSEDMKSIKKEFKYESSKNK